MVSVRRRSPHAAIRAYQCAPTGAVKFIRSVRKWSYETFGDERAISITVMATPEDLK